MVVTPCFNVLHLGEVKGSSQSPFIIDNIIVIKYLIFGL
jgi:hypothetical protein